MHDSASGAVHALSEQDKYQRETGEAALDVCAILELLQEFCQPRMELHDASKQLV